MKNRILSFFINPFTRIAGWQALSWGIVILLLTAYMGFKSGVYFDGVLDFHYIDNVLLWKSIIILIADILAITCTLGISALIIGKKFRWIDLLGTLTLSRFPFMILAFVALFSTAPNLKSILENPTSIFQSISFVILLILSFPVLIWFVVLTLNAYKVSCDIKGNKATISFIISLLTAEIISKIIFFYLI